MSKVNETTDIGDANRLTNSELIIGLACAIGTDIKNVINLLSDQLSYLGYTSEVIKISKQLIEPTIEDEILKTVSSYSRVNKLMDQGNELRKGFLQGHIVSLLQVLPIVLI